MLRYARPRLSSSQLWYQVSGPLDSFADDHEDDSALAKLSTDDRVNYFRNNFNFDDQIWSHSSMPGFNDLVNAWKNKGSGHSLPDTYISPIN